MTDPRLFGRDAELAVLAELIEHARERGSALAVLGGAGIGKSTLLRAAVEQARSAGFQVLQTAGVTGRTPMKGMAVMFKSTSTSLILRGVLAIIVGIIALAWPSVTILALVTLFAIYAFIDAGVQQRQSGAGRRTPAARADRPRGRGSRPGLARAHRAFARAGRGNLGGHRR